VGLGAEGDLEAVQLVDPGGELLQAARVLHHRQLTQPVPRVTLKSKSGIPGYFVDLNLLF
jgi:hypothetical protein